jgi:hypothetical protein
MTSRRVDEDGDELKVHHYITIEPSHDGNLAVTACGDELEENGATLEGFHYIPPALRCRECKRIFDKLCAKILLLEWSYPNAGSGQIKIGWITGDPLPYYVRSKAFDVLDAMVPRECRKLTFGPTGALVSNEPHTP